MTQIAKFLIVKNDFENVRERFPSLGYNLDSAVWVRDTGRRNTQNSTRALILIMTGTRDERKYCREGACLTHSRSMF